MGFPNRNVLHLDGITEVLNLIGEKGEVRFSVIMKSLQERKNPQLKNAAVLSYRLRGLEMFGLIEKRVDNNAGEQVKIFYRLTKEGREALLHLNELNEIVQKACHNVERQP